MKGIFRTFSHLSRAEKSIDQERGTMLALAISSCIKRIIDYL